ncbi:hypothetical protein HB852_03195 [Listeria grandensis]|uniref:hypothetical protein n=1 Tax=Listeria grandensis TaxID=1494963 RepID=UPI00162409CD|nr:hypothetical protein [Listeria grandensis]MBC1473630.1 hypothetical protein [Listeria grandensis]
MKKFIEAHNFPFQALKKHLKLMTTSEKIVDIFIPILIITIVSYIFWGENIKVWIMKFKEWNTPFRTIFSIVIGFNITSLSMLGVSLSEKVRERLGKSNFEELINIYVSTIIVQLFVLLYGVFVEVFLIGVINNEITKVAIISSFLLDLLVLTFFLRGLKMVYRILIN